MMEIKNLKKAAERIIKAAKDKENIILYGDADLDGVTSVIILKETIRNLGSPITAVYFLDREKEGYGLNKKALHYLKDKAPGLLLVLDCGIGNFEEVDLAKKLGFEVIIIDHHEILEKIPKASIVVDPKQKDDLYPFKGLATAGIVFRLSQILLEKNFTESLRKNFLELVALATIADLMPRIDENQIFIKEGVESLRNTWRPGLKAFFEINSLRDYQDFHRVVQKIISSLNASGIKDHLAEAYLILTAKDEIKAKTLAENLLEKSRLRKIRIEEITAQLEERILGKTEQSIIFEGAPDWPVTSLGSVASKICHNYQKPIFLFRKDEKESQGAVRMPRGLDGVKAMASCSALLETYGGHAPACGFRIKNENLEEFRECLIKYFKQILK